jgi:multiple sugar transport system substrate-binding protein
VEDATPVRGEEGVAEAVEGLAGGRLTREAFVRRATALGLSAGTIGAILTGFEGAASAAPAAARKRFAGQTVNILIAAEGDEKGVRDKLSDIKSKLGIDVKVTALAVGPLLEKANQAFRAPTSPYDAIMVLGFSVSQMVGGGNFQPLNAYLNSSKTPKNYNFKDFPAGQLLYVGYFNIKKQQFGGSTLYLIPGLHGGSAVMFYRKDLLAKAGLKVPTTWPAYLRAAEKLNTGGVSGNAMVGKSADVSMFLVDWYTRFITMGGKLMSGSPANKTFTPHLTSKPAVDALQHMVDCVKFAPKGVLSYDFTAEVNAFSAGKVGLMLAWSTIGGPIFNPKSSKVASSVQVAPPPGNTPALAGQAVRGGWGMGIPKNAANKDAAWAVITYLTSKQWELYQTETYQTDPSRSSIYTDPALVKKLPYLPVAGKVFRKAKILDIALIPQTFELITDASTAFYAALNGDSSAADACKKANDIWIQKLKRDKHLA